MKDRIIIRNARQHNLKGVDLDLPRRSLVVLTGPSGSGKSSLAFDTLYAEGQRRYVESLSTYAKQFLERMEKPAVDGVDGISPAVAIEQKNPTKTSRSTVGTATEVYDYLRLLWARVGRTVCPACGREVRPDTVQSATDEVLRLPEGTRIMVAFPLPRSARASHARVVENLRALGFVRVRVGDEVVDLDGPEAGTPAGLGHDLTGVDEVQVVVDRLVVRDGVAERLADSLATAFHEGEGEAVVVCAGPSAGAEGVGTAGVEGARSVSARVLRFTERFRCPEHPELRFLDPTPRLFSFNNPYGSCPTCTGFGAVLEYDPTLIVPNPARSLREGAVDPWEKPRYHRERARLLAFARERGVSPDAPWRELPEDFRHAVLHGTRGFKGMLPFLRSRERKRYKPYIRVFLRQYQSAQPCRDCGGSRLRPEARNVKVRGRDIGEVAELPIAELRDWVAELSGASAGAAAAAPPPGASPGVPGASPDGDGSGASRRGGRAAAGGGGFDGGGGGGGGLRPPARGDGAGPALSPQERAIAAPILRELDARLGFLCDVGLGYLALSRQMRTLSGGEAQRIALANSLGASLVDTLYVLDEPTVGLHPRDTDRLLGLLRRLRDRGNSVLVVEHDDAAIEAADVVVELGPGSGERGGEIVFQGTPAELKHGDTATGRHLSGRDRLDLPEKRRPVDRARLELRGARLHNLRGVDVDIPLGALTVVTGVSGSGKSTLVHDVLYRAVERELSGGESSAKQHLGEEVGAYDRLDGVHHIDAVVLVDQSPIGRTPRSNPVTYIKAFDAIRQIFARQPLAKQRKYTAGHFSFNVKGGRCEACQGDGVIEVEMVFMADVFVPCEVCRGARYKPETLEVTYKGHNIRQVLDLTVDEAIRLFIKEDRLGQALWHLQQVGLGYLRLGQPAPTLSGGEAQRLKIARELAGAGRKGEHRLYILDEPTTGLSGAEVRQLIQVLRKLLQHGHSVVVIEHNLEVMCHADWIIDLGPEAGDGGGRVVAMGRPEEVAAGPGHTARYLRAALEAPVALRAPGARP
ncbi:MAG TPA: excinuclease ABC subunit UvrA [Longimicrobiales bacterium]